MIPAVSIPASLARERIARDPLWWVSLLAVVTSMAATALLCILAGTVFSIAPTFTPLQWRPFISFGGAGALGVVILFLLIVWFAHRSIRLFVIVSGSVVLLSWLPDTTLLISKSIPGTTPVTVGTLMVMHLVVTAISVSLLTALTRKRTVLSVVLSCLSKQAEKTGTRSKAYAIVWRKQDRKTRVSSRENARGRRFLIEFANKERIVL